MENIENRRPVVAIHADLSVFDFAPLQKDEETDSYKIVVFEIGELDVSPTSPKNPMVNVSFSITENEKISFRMPIQFLSVSYTLSAQQVILGGVPMLFFDSSKVKTINPARVFKLEEAAFALTFPDKESEEGDKIAEIFANVIHDSVAFPTAPYGWNQVQVEKTDEYRGFVEESMAQSLSATLGLSRGDLSPLIHISELLIAKLDALEEGDSLGAPIDFYFMTMAKLVECAKLSSPKLKNAYSNDLGNESRLSIFGHSEFNRLLENADLQDSLEKIFKKNDNSEKGEDTELENWTQNVKLWNSPAHESWDEAMEPVRNYLGEMGGLETLENIIGKIATTEFKDEESHRELREEFGDTNVLLAMYLYMAMQAYKQFSIQPTQDVFLTAQSTIISWFSFWDTDIFWELPATGIDLVKYSTQTSADVVLYGAHGTGENFTAPYFISVMIQVGVFLMVADDWAGLETDELAEELNSLGYQGQEFKDFESFILRYHRKINEAMNEEESEQKTDEEVAHHALMQLLDPSMDFRKLAEVFMLVFPVLSEIKANMEAGINNYERFSDEWNYVRSTYLSETLFEMSGEIGRLVGHVENF